MSEQGDKARKALHDLRWGPHIEGVIERQEAMDNAIRVALQVVTALEADADALLALKDYAVHDEACAFEGKEPDEWCTCGFSKAILALPEHLKPAHNQEENPHLFPGMNAAMLYPPKSSKRGKG